MVNHFRQPSPAKIQTRRLTGGYFGSLGAGNRHPTGRATLDLRDKVQVHEWIQRHNQGNSTVCSTPSMTAMPRRCIGRGSAVKKRLAGGALTPGKNVHFGTTMEMFRISEVTNFPQH